MGTSHGYMTASKAPDSPLHAMAYSPPAKSPAVPTEGVKTSRTCTRIEGHLYASDSLPCLFGAVHGHLPRIHNREQGSRLAEARDSLLPTPANASQRGRAN